MVFFLGFQIIVDRLAIGSRNRRHIKGCLHTTFDLKTVDPRIDQFRDMLDHAKIFGIKDISSSLILIDRQILARPLFLYHRVFPAARMGTGTTVGISSGKIIAEQASAGIGNAHSPMDKSLDLQIIRDILTNFLDLLQR